MINRFPFGVYQAGEPPRWSSRLVVAMALAAFISPFAGCFGAGSAGGEGTVDLASAKTASMSNPDTAKAASVRGNAGIADAQESGRR
jgi:hypothetical protein